MALYTKKLLILTGCLVLAACIIWIFGLFPIARVNGEIVLYRTYDERTNALELFEVKSRTAAGNKSLTDAEREEFYMSTLQNLLAERIFQQYINEHAALSGLKESAGAVVERTLKDADPDVLPRATKELYGWSVDEFKRQVLFPQALQNELQTAIERDGTPFDEFARTQLNNAQIKLYFVPWRWEKGDLVEK